MATKSKKGSNRREFLKYSSALVGGAGMMNLGALNSYAASSSPQGEVDLENLRLVDYDPEPQLITKESYVPRSRYSAIDVHNHLRKIVDKGPEFIEQYVRKMDECNVQAIVDLDGRWGEILDRHLEVLKKPYPDRFYIYARVDWSRIDEPDFSERAVEELERAVEKGVQGLKISKQLGLGVKDAQGNYVPVDTPKMDPVWEKCGELGIPVEIHTSDPQAFFTTFDEHNERYEELVDNQNWMFNKPEFFGKDELLQQRNNVVERHPGTIIIGAHFGNLPENLGKVGEWLDKYPNFYVDVDARLSELGRQPYSARRFIIKYQDRIMFGTDGNAMDQPIEDMYRTAWRFLETDDEYFDIKKSHKFQARWRVYGLFLPDDVLKKIYQTNALKLIPGSKLTI